jgi:hypothetical protein
MLITAFGGPAPGSRGEYGELGAYHLAHGASRACVGLDDVRRMVAVVIELRRLLEDLLGAELNAETATFAALTDYVHFTGGTFVVLRIERQSSGLRGCHRKLKLRLLFSRFPKSGKAMPYLVISITMLLADLAPVKVSLSCAE